MEGILLTDEETRFLMESFNTGSEDQKQGCHFSEGKPFISECDSGDGIVRTDEQMRAFAKHLGLDLRVATDRELFVDIDSEEDWKRFEHAFPVVGKQFCSGRKWQFDCTVTPSKSGLPKRHVVVRLAAPQPLLVRIALQAALGSDGRREGISVLRAQRGEENVVVFFEPHSLPPVEPPMEQAGVPHPGVLPSEDLDRFVGKPYETLADDPFWVPAARVEGVDEEVVGKTVRGEGDGQLD